MSSPALAGILTQHALLVLWGQLAQHLGLPQAFARLPLHQQTYHHTPLTKLLEFFVAIRGGLPDLLDISHAAQPLDQDQPWRRPASSPPGPSPVGSAAPCVV